MFAMSAAVIFKALYLDKVSEAHQCYSKDCLDSYGFDEAPHKVLLTSYVLLI